MTIFQHPSAMDTFGIIMIIETIRISQQGKEQLIRLKRFTGIMNWNVLCRWAFLVSIAEKSTPQYSDFNLDSSVEMTWRVFAGKNHEIYTAILVQRCKNDNLELSQENLQKYFKLHLHRGIGYLSASNSIKTIEDLVRKVLPDVSSAEPSTDI